MGAGFGLASSFLASLASRNARHSTVLFVLLGATLGPVTHLFAVTRGLLEKPPALRGASPAAAVLVSFPEFALFSCAIVLVAALLRRLFPVRQPGT